MKMKIELEADSIPDLAIPIAKIALAIYTDPRNGKRRASVPYVISPTASRESMILTHLFLDGLNDLFVKCEQKAKEQCITELSEFIEATREEVVK